MTVGAKFQIFFLSPLSIGQNWLIITALMPIVIERKKSIGASHERLVAFFFSFPPWRAGYQGILSGLFFMPGDSSPRPCRNQPVRAPLSPFFFFFLLSPVCRLKYAGGLLDSSQTGCYRGCTDNGHRGPLFFSLRLVGGRGCRKVWLLARGLEGEGAGSPLFFFGAAVFRRGARRCGGLRPYPRT